MSPLGKIIGFLLMLVTIGCGSNASPGAVKDGSSGGDNGAAEVGAGASGGSLDAITDGVEAREEADRPAGTTDAEAGEAGEGPDSSVAHDECRTDIDCPAINCLVAQCPDPVCTLATDGSHRCAGRARPLGSCSGAPQPCCTSDVECTAKAHGLCVSTAVGWTAPTPPPAGNHCVYDECSSDAECSASPNGFCTAMAPRTCLYGPCRSSADCTKSQDGRCVLDTVGVLTGGASPLLFQSLKVLCRYPGDPCRADGDCKASTGPPGQACVVASDLQGTICVDRPGPPQ